MKENNKTENHIYDSRTRPLLILDILRIQTDEDHYMTAGDLCEILRSEYGIDIDRRTLTADIAALQKTGYEISSVRSHQMLYGYVERDFDDAELKMLIDAVEASRIIPSEKSRQLIRKLTGLTSSYKASELQRNLLVNSKYKAENEKVFYIIDAVNEAINLKKKIRFQMLEYSMDKELILHNSGEWYTFSPYSLVWDGDCYYVVGYSDKYNGPGSHRVDRIAAAPEILKEDAVPMEADFDLNRFVNTMFHMCNAERRNVELICCRDTLDAVIDRFGAYTGISPCNDEAFTAEVDVAVSQGFYNWIFGFGGRVKITGPDDVKEGYLRRVRAALKQEM